MCCLSIYKSKHFDFSRNIIKTVALLRMMGEVGLLLLNVSRGAHLQTRLALHSLLFRFPFPYIHIYFTLHLYGTSAVGVCIMWAWYIYIQIRLLGLTCRITVYIYLLCICDDVCSQVTCSRSSDHITLPADKHKKDDTPISPVYPRPVNNPEMRERRSRLHSKP